MLEEPTLLNKGAIPFKFEKKEKTIVEKEKTIVEPSCCVLRNTSSAITFDYNISQYVNYLKYVPYYIRYVNPYYGFEDYNVAINSKTEYGCCLKKQVLGSINLELLNLEEIFNVFIPSILITNPLQIKYKDTIRNQFIAFCLNIEKTYLFYNEGKITCNNLIVPWGNITPFSLNQYQTDLDTCDRTIIYNNQKLLDPLDQYNIYTLSVNYFEVFNNSININYETILKIAYNQPYVRTSTDTNFFQIINYTYTLMSFLFGTSRTLLLGLETGLSKLFIETFFPRDRQLYYYNLYNSWIISRIHYTGFGTRINSSNGDGTFVQIPQQSYSGWKTSWN
jgi:hypothetical protein